MSADPNYLMERGISGGDDCVVDDSQLERITVSEARWERVLKGFPNKHLVPRDLDPFVFACLEGHLDLVKHLLKKEGIMAKVKINTPICVAKGTADAYLGGFNGMTPIKIAVHTRNLDILKYLVSMGGDLKGSASKTGKESKETEADDLLLAAAWVNLALPQSTTVALNAYLFILTFISYPLSE